MLGGTSGVACKSYCPGITVTVYLEIGLSAIFMVRVGTTDEGHDKREDSLRT
jgi:hypothetical protein